MRKIIKFRFQKNHLGKFSKFRSDTCLCAKKAPHPLLFCTQAIEITTLFVTNEIYNNLWGKFASITTYLFSYKMYKFQRYKLVPPFFPCKPINFNYHISHQQFQFCPYCVNPMYLAKTS